jgi:hypothetical protein
VKQTRPSLRRAFAAGVAIIAGAAAVLITTTPAQAATPTITAAAAVTTNPRVEFVDLCDSVVRLRLTNLSPANEAVKFRIFAGGSGYDPAPTVDFGASSTVILPANAGLISVVVDGQIFGQIWSHKWGDNPLLFPLASACLNVAFEDNCIGTKVTLVSCARNSRTISAE